MRHTRHIAGLLLFALFWSDVGDSSNFSELVRADLPEEVLNDCPAVEKTTGGSSCHEAGYRIAWINRTPRGDLFLVERDICEIGGCRGWLVIRDADGRTRALLTVVGAIHLGSQTHFPTVQTRQELADQLISYNRYEWTGERYARTETRLVHRIDGFECGDEHACREAAQDALQRNDADRAVRIWQQVYGVSWI